MDTAKDKLFGVMKNGKEAKIQIFVVVEIFRLAAFLWFLFLIVFGIILTASFTQEDYTKILKDIFGIVSVCAYFDFYPATHVLPIIYAFFPILVFLYCISSIFRAWISMAENKISLGSCVFYSLTFVYLFVSSLLLSHC